MVSGSGIKGLRAVGAFRGFWVKAYKSPARLRAGGGGGGQGSIQRRASMLELYSRSPKLGNPIASILKSNV